MRDDCDRAIEPSLPPAECYRHTHAPFCRTIPDSIPVPIMRIEGVPATVRPNVWRNASLRYKRSRNRVTTAAHSAGRICKSRCGPGISTSSAAGSTPRMCSLAARGTT